MSEFLLVHGSCHGAWCWRDVISALAALGHAAHAIDLPGHGDDPTPLAEITLDACVRAITAAAGPDTIVVGHSWGGIPIGAAAGVADLRALVFLCAYVPKDGLSMSDVRKAAPRQPILPAVIPGKDRQTYTVDPAKAPALFYNDCPPEAVSYAMPRLCAQASLPQVTPAVLGPRFDTTPKHYIRCTDDQTIPPEYQAEMVAGWPPGHVHEIATGHSPFFAAPERLAGILDAIAKDL